MFLQGLYLRPKAVGIVLEFWMWWITLIQFNIYFLFQFFTHGPFGSRGCKISTQMALKWNLLKSMHMESCFKKLQCEQHGEYKYIYIHMSYDSVWKRHVDPPVGILATSAVDYGATCWKNRPPHPQKEK